MGGGGYNRRNLARAWTRVVEAFLDSPEEEVLHDKGSETRADG
jgi:hypothetical protein